MDIHKNARLTPHSRADLMRRVVVEGQSKIVVAAAFGVCIETVRKWVRRFREEGEAGLMDRSSRPHRLRNPTPELIVGRVAALRRQRYTGQQIAADLKISPATVSRILRRLGLNKLSALEPAEPVRRYEREHPCELIHIDIKKLGRFVQTALREWAYAKAYQHSDQRAAELPFWQHRYNWHRPHASLKAKPPISRLGLSEDNLLRLHI